MKIPQYTALDNKKIIFNSGYTKIDSVDDLNKMVEELSTTKNNVYRGVSQAKYKNYTSAQRKYFTEDYKTTKVDLKKLLRKEVASLRKRENSLLSKYYKSLNIQTNDLLYLSIAQHYGGFSPLLDFSEDYKVALYFMANNIKIDPNGMDEIDNYMSIYVMSRSENTIDSYVKKNIPTVEEKIGGSKELPKNYNLCQEFFNIEMLTSSATTIFIPNKTVMIPIKNQLLGNEIVGNFTISNLNIVAQKGCFLYYFDNAKPEQPLEAGLKCYDIHKSLAQYIISEKSKKKESSIYPDEYEIVRDACNMSSINLFKK